jgi:hypothetical protein
MAKKSKLTQVSPTPHRPLFLPKNLPPGYSNWQEWYSQNPNPPTLPVKSTSPKAGKEIDMNRIYHRQTSKETGMFNPLVVQGLTKSSKGALGMAQAMPAALAEYKKKFKEDIDVTIPENSVKFQKWMMGDLMGRNWINHSSNESDTVKVAKALAAYNYGPTNVINTLNKAKQKGIDIYSNKLEWLKELPEETSDYVNKILLAKDPKFEKEYAEVKDKYWDLYSPNVPIKEDGGPIYNTGISSVSTQKTFQDNNNYANTFESSIADNDGFRQYYKQTTPGSLIHYAGDPATGEQVSVNNQLITDPFLKNFLYTKAGYQTGMKKDGGPVYNWIPPNYPRVGARNKQGGWLEKYANGDKVGKYARKGETYNEKRAAELGYTPDAIGHLPSVDYETSNWLKSAQHSTAWKEHLYGYLLNPAVSTGYNLGFDFGGYFGKNQLKYYPKKEDGGTIEDQRIPTPTTPSFYPDYPDRTLTNYQMGTPKAPMYGPGGGVNTLEGNMIANVLMNRNRDKDFVQRAYAVGKNPNSPMFNLFDPEEFGSKMSHKMAWGEDDKGQAYMFPTVMNSKDEAIKVPNQYADYISSQGYKNATGIPAYAHGATVWNKRLADEQMSAAYVVGPDTKGTQVKNTYPDRMSGAENPTNYKIGDVIPTGMDYKSPAAGTYDYNKDVQPYYKMRLHAPDTTRMAYNGYVPAYKSGGFLRQAGEFAFGALEGTLDTVTGGMTDSLTDMAHDALSQAANTTYDDKAGQRLKRLHGAGKIGGAIAGGIASGNVAGAIGQGAEGTNDILQYSPNASEDLKKWGGLGLNLAQMGSGFMGGMNNTGQMAKFNATDIGKYAGQAGKVGKGLNMFQSGDIMGMMNMFQPQGMGSFRNGGDVDVEVKEVKPTITGGVSAFYQKNAPELPLMGGNISGYFGGKLNPSLSAQGGFGAQRSAMLAGQLGVSPHIKVGNVMFNPSASVGLSGGVNRGYSNYITDPSGLITEERVAPTFAGNIFSKAKVKAAYTGLPKNYEFDPYMSAEVIKDPYGTRLPISAGLDFGRDTFVQGSYDPLSNTFGVGAQFNFGGEKNPYKYKGKARQPKVTPTTRTFADGGDVPPYVTSDPKEFARRKKAYSDSLALFNSAYNFDSDRSWGKDEHGHPEGLYGNASFEQLSPFEKREVKEEKIYVNNPNKINKNIKPTGREYMLHKWGASAIDLYKKPIQKIILEELLPMRGLPSDNIEAMPQKVNVPESNPLPTQYMDTRGEFSNVPQVPPVYTEEQLLKMGYRAPQKKANGGWLDSYEEGGDVDITKPYLNPATVQSGLAKANQPVTTTTGRVISTPASREKERREKVIAKDQSKYSVEDYKKGIQEPGAGNSVLDDPLAMAFFGGFKAGQPLAKALGQYGKNVASEATTGITDFSKGVKSLYNEIATGESSLPIAWKSPAVNLTQEESERMFKELQNNRVLTPQEKAIMADYAAGSTPYTGFNSMLKKHDLTSTVKKNRRAMHNIIATASLKEPSSKVILTRRVRPDVKEFLNFENNLFNLGNRPTSFSAGVGGTMQNIADTDRIVVPNRSLKEAHPLFIKQVYEDLPEETILEMVNRVDPKDIRRRETIEKFGRAFSDATAKEREVVGTGLNMKRIGKVKNNLGGYDHIVRFHKQGGLIDNKKSSGGWLDNLK